MSIFGLLVCGFVEYHFLTFRQKLCSGFSTIELGLRSGLSVTHIYRVFGNSHYKLLGLVDWDFQISDLVKNPDGTDI